MIIAIDIGGTKTLLTSYDVSGHSRAIQRLDTLSDANQFITQLQNAITNFNPESSDMIIVASAGIIDRDSGTIVNSPNLHWVNIPIKEILSRIYPCPIYIENDANIGALGATLALSKIPPLVLYITIGTGIGGGIVVEGKFNHIFNHIEVGHMLFTTPEGLKTWESMASGLAIVQQFGREASKITSADAWETITDRLSIGFRTLIPAFQPDLILIGGGVGTEFDKFGHILSKKLRRELPSFIPLPPIQKASEPEKAVLNGCYQYARQITSS